MSNQVAEKSETTQVKLGTLLVEKGVLKEEDVRYGLEVQKQMDRPQPLGEVLVALKCLTRPELKNFLKLYKTMIPIGELLVENGVLSRSQLEEALDEQKTQTGTRLGGILIEKGFISERDLIKAICEQKEIPFVEPNLAMLDDTLVNRISFNYLIEKNLIPMSMEDGNLWVIAGDLPERHTVRELENVLECKLQIALAPETKIKAVLTEYGKVKADDLSMTSPVDPDRKIIELSNFFISEAIELGASDLHFEPLRNRLRLRYRIDGVLVHRTDLPKEMEARLISRIKVLGELDIAEKRRHQDGRFHFALHGKEVDIRVSTYVTVHGENLVMRILNRKMGLLDLEELGMPSRLLENYKDFVLGAPAGVVVITGPTGSGKTTTLYSSIDSCNDMGVKIITAEDPVEYQIDGIMQCSINPRIGLTFNDTLKSIVRQDPDIIVLGEIRDRVSAETAIQAALTGHKVFTTFHTEDAVGGLLRLMNMEIESFLISSTVICMVAQRLIRKICEHCKRPAPPSAKSLFLMGLDASELSGFTFYHGRGCEHCHYTGYKGRTAIYELLVLNEKVKDAILENRTSYYIRKISIEGSGLVTMSEAGIAKVIQGVSTFDEVLQKAPNSIKPRPVKEIFTLIGEDL